MGASHLFSHWQHPVWRREIRSLYVALRSPDLPDGIQGDIVINECRSTADEIVVIQTDAAVNIILNAR